MQTDVVKHTMTNNNVSRNAFTLQRETDCEETMDLLNEFIKEHFAASVIVIIIAVIGLVFLVWWCSSLYHKIRRIEQLPCGEHGGRMSELEKTMTDIREDLALIKSVIVQKYPTSANVFSVKKSPRKLNDKGEWLFEQVKGKDFLEKNKDFLFGKMDEVHPTTALDVENAAHIACSGSTAEPMFSEIKSFVYNAPSIEIHDQDTGSRKYDITLGDDCFVISLPLRDMYLSEHPEIKE